MMDLATRKRYHSSSLETSAAKVQALDFNFADMMTIHLLHTLNNTESSQKLPLLDDLIARIQWLKQQQQQQQFDASNAPSKKVSPIGSPRQPEPKTLDHKFLQTNIQKQQEMLQKMSKIINFTAHNNPPPVVIPDPPPVLKISSASPVPVTVTVSAPVANPASVPPPSAPIKTPNRTPRLSPAPIPPPPTLTPSAPAIITATSEPNKRKMGIPKKTEVPPPPTPQFPKKMQTPEELMMDLQSKQRKLLSYISSAHNGNVTDEVLHDYLKHPYVLLKENGVVRQQPNPFFHLMGIPPTSQASNWSPKMLPPTTVPRKSTTPIPAPPVLLPQVELPIKNNKKENTTPIEKVSPPPQLPPQLPLQVPLENQKTFDTTPRSCNQWSVFSMALPLRLICRCYPMPCTCQKQ